MLKPKQIPDEVVEAAARAIAVAEWGDDKMWDPFIKRAEAAIAAAINAWPGMGPIRTDQPIGEWCDKLPAIILPLPKGEDE